MGWACRPQSPPFHGGSILSPPRTCRFPSLASRYPAPRRACCNERPHRCAHRSSTTRMSWRPPSGRRPRPLGGSAAAAVAAAAAAAAAPRGPHHRYVHGREGLLYAALPQSGHRGWGRCQEHRGFTDSARPTRIDEHVVARDVGDCSSGSGGSGGDRRRDALYNGQDRPA